MYQKNTADMSYQAQHEGHQKQMHRPEASYGAAQSGCGCGAGYGASYAAPSGGCTLAAPAAHKPACHPAAFHAGCCSTCGPTGCYQKMKYAYGY